MPKRKAKTEAIVTVRFPLDLHAQMIAAAEADDRSQNSLVLRAVRAYLAGVGFIEPPKKVPAK